MPHLPWLHEAEPSYPGTWQAFATIRVATHLLWLHHARAAHDSLAALQLPKKGSRPHPQLPGSLRQELARDVLKAADVAGSWRCLQTMKTVQHALAMRF